MSTEVPITAEQLLRMPEKECRYELIAGRLQRREFLGWREGAIVSRLGVIVSDHIQRERLGRVFAGGTGFLLAQHPDTVRSPAFAFVRKETHPPQDAGDVYWPGAPDLAVEVVSPGDTLGDVDEKVEAWLAAGAAIVWVVNPKWRSVTVYRSATDIKVLTEKDQLDGQDIVPGFRCPVGDIFRNL